jgi:glycosyltransferase involved in cell wall biosynthesis
MDTTTEIKEPLVSILMLTYNRANYISEAISSVLAQTYQNWQLIIIDDGSTDNTAELLSKYTDPRIVYIKDTVNKGLLVRRRESLTKATGVYVAILDSDDIWIHKEKLAKQVAILESEPQCAVVGSFIHIINETGSTLATNSYQTTDQEIRKHILVRNQFANSSVLMRKTLLDQTEGYRKFDMAEDFELFLQLGLVGTMANIPEYLIAYRVHTTNISARKRALFLHVLEVIKLHQKNYPRYYLAWLKFTLYRIYLLIK